MLRPSALLAALVLIAMPRGAAGQDPPVATGAGPESTSLLAAPPALRGGATVLGQGGAPRSADVLTTLRAGDGPLVCLADDPAEEGFEVSCYHRDLDPFMALGRVLRAEGADRTRVMEARYAALEAGEIRMPPVAVLYSLSAPTAPAPEDPARPAGARRLVVVYLPYATAESTGLPTAPDGAEPWLMLPGTPWAHIMIPR
jgi:hypothetical protein